MLTGRPLEQIEKLAAKDVAEDLDGEKERILGKNPTGVAWSKPPAGTTQWR